LVVDSRVTRDDGEEGLVLEFENLSDQAHEYLKKMVSFLPILAAGDDGGEGVIVSELLERKSA
jgi:type IV secretory pathway VirJ component